MNKMIRTFIISLLLAIVGSMDMQADNTSDLQMVFVDPYSGNASNAGTSWQDALRDIQTGIDMANRFFEKNNKQTYVLVKGSKTGIHTNKSITMRNGVSVIGSIDDASAIDCIYTSDNYASYINDVLALREGIASPSSYKTIVSEINTDGSSYSNEIMTLVDGFVVTPSGNDNQNSPAIDVENENEVAMLALRNIIVCGYSKTGTDIVKMKNALLYEALIRDNHCATGNALSLIDDAYTVNVTAEGKTSGENILNSLVNYNERPVIKNTLSGHIYCVDDPNLNYQLTEGSKSIDAGSISIDDLPANFQSFINYSTDRDLLGNPRLLTDVSSDNKVDLGAFETWRIDKSVVTTTQANNYYPHEGSVVYLMNGSNLVLGHDLTPGYLLLKDGASIYSIHYDETTNTFNKYNVNIAYIAVERKDIKKNGSVVSLPFDMRYTADVTYPYIDETTGITSLEEDRSSVYTYDGSKRSDWKYSFAKADSPCWIAIGNNTETKACVGVLYVPNGNHAGKTLRFTRKSNSMSSYVYTESENEVYKTVTLYKYNNYEAQNFTNSEDMGWNCIGMPYLISRYQTFYSAHENIHGYDYSGHYLMDIPHAMWLYYDGEQRPDGSDFIDTDGDGGFYYISSIVNSKSGWNVNSASDVGIWMGEGFFIQNTKWSGDETLTFFRPFTNDDWYKSVKSGSKLTNSRYYYNDTQSNEISKIINNSNIELNMIGNKLYIKNTNESININIYTPDGKEEMRDHTENADYSISLDHGIHIVYVNGKAHKAYAK